MNSRIFIIWIVWGEVASFHLQMLHFKRSSAQKYRSKSTLKTLMLVMILRIMSQLTCIQIAKTKRNFSIEMSLKLRWVTRTKAIGWDQGSASNRPYLRALLITSTQVEGSTINTRATRTKIRYHHWIWNKTPLDHRNSDLTQLLQATIAILRLVNSTWARRKKRRREAMIVSRSMILAGARI